MVHAYVRDGPYLAMNAQRAWAQCVRIPAAGITHANGYRLKQCNYEMYQMPRGPDSARVASVCAMRKISRSTSAACEIVPETWTAFAREMQTWSSAVKSTIKAPGRARHCKLGIATDTLR
jgi:hypothetical protein